MDIEKLKFPIGSFIFPTTVSAEQLNLWKNDIAQLPEKLAALTQPLSTEELSYIYRPNGWTVKQVVHHLADSHMNSFIRFKLTLTEEIPTIKPYAEHLWAQLIDGNTDAIENSLLILKGIHAKWSLLLNNLSPKELQRQFFHPDANKKISLEEAIGLYAWHGNHHLAHIKTALVNKGKYKNE